MTYRVAHYLNQFFGGIGGEEHAGAAPVLRAGPVGPGILLQQCLGSEATIAGTVICGDNRMAERGEETLPEVLEMIRSLHPDLLVAGPAFAAGRYGLACAMVGATVERALGIPVVTALSPENPGSEGLDPGVIGVLAGDTAATARPAIERMARIGLKLLRGEPLGPADVEGYLPTGRRVNEFGEATGAERMVEMLLRRLRREPFTSEVVVPRFDGVTPAPPVRDLREIVLGMVTTSGVVRQGNPEGVESWRATKWVRYSLAGLDRMSADEYTCVHGGYDNRHVRADPNRTVPLDVLREWEKQGRIGRLHPTLWSTVGNVMPVEWARQRGREVAQELREAGIQAAILTAT
jgi:glycine reductase complex component B subunit gamma